MSTRREARRPAERLWLGSGIETSQPAAGSLGDTTAMRREWTLVYFPEADFPPVS